MSTIVKEAIRKLSIECPYKVLKIENVKLTNKPNEHGYLYVKCLIDDSINFKYSIEASTNDNIILYEILDDEKGTIEKNILFNGITENVRTTNIDGIYYLEIEALTSSCLLDIEEKSRSFQDEQMSYDDVIYEILKDYPGFGFGQCMSMPMRIGKPIFQYKETDYEFLKRIASHLGLELVSDIINMTNMFYFGKPTGKAYIVNEDVNYRAAKNIDMYNKMSVFDEKLHDTDYFYYEVKLRESMKIGDLIKFKTRDFYVYNYEAQYVKGELMYTYRFCRPNGIWQEKVYNKKLSGISLEGTVLETTGEILKLKLNIDEKQDISKAAWFIFAPPTGNIFYSMPIVGDNVMLYFQNEYDRPVVTGCVRKNGDTFGRCANPNNRYYATESGNYLDMLPGAVNLYRGGMHVSFNDENGISLSSNTSLNIGTPAGISMSAGNVSISGSNKLIVSKSKGGFISLENELYNEGTVVYENGSCRELFAPFTDDVPDLNELLSIQSQINLKKFNPSADLMSAMAGSQAKAGECYITKASENSKSENSHEPSTLDKVLDFLGFQTCCYAATKDEESKNTNKKFNDNISTANDPIRFMGKNNIKKFNPSYEEIEIKGEEYYITQDSGNSRQINEYEYDAEKVRNAKHIEDKVKYLFKYGYDRVFTYGSEVFEYIALINGMDPKYAKLYGDFTAGMIVESALTISISGVKSGNALINGEVASQGDIVVGSGAGNIKKGDSYSKVVTEPSINRRQALNQAKDSAGIPRSQQPTRQWTIADDITKKGGNYKNYEYSENVTHHGRYYEYDTTQGKKIIVEHTNDVEQGLHTHAGEVPNDANPLTYDFKNPDNRYKPINKDSDHHIRYTDK